VQGRLGDDYVREALDMRSWEGAQEHVRDWEAKGSMEEDVKRVTIEEASEKFIRAWSRKKPTLVRVK
jgi:hypothetical protein